MTAGGWYICSTVCSKACRTWLRLQPAVCSKWRHPVCPVEFVSLTSWKLNLRIAYQNIIKPVLTLIHSKTVLKMGRSVWSDVMPCCETWIFDLYLVPSSLLFFLSMNFLSSKFLLCQIATFHSITGLFNWLLILLHLWGPASLITSFCLWFLCD